MAFEEPTTFANYRGVLSGIASGGDTGLLTGETGDDRFFKFGPGLTPFFYWKNGIQYEDPADYPAPMNGNFALVEAVVDAAQTAFDGIQVGRNRGFAHIHKGWWIEQLIYSTQKTQSEIERIRLYFNLKYKLFRLGSPLSLYFPSDDIVGFPRSRFYAEPPQYSKVTDSYEFEDGGRDFNEVADVAPRRWEYEYTHRTPEQRFIFDAFFDTARLINPFIFRDKYGNEWPNVRVEKYQPEHERHKSWINEIKFDLISFGGAVVAGAPAEEPPPPGADIALIANAAAGSADGGATSTTAAIDTTGANFLVVAAIDDGSTTISDSKGNTWTLLSPNANGEVALWYCANANVGTGHTFTVSNSGFSPIAVQAFANVKLSSPLDGSPTGGVTSGIATVQPGSITPSEANCLLVTATTSGSSGANNATSINSSFTKTDAIGFTGGQNYAIAMGYKIQTTAGAENPTWTWNDTGFSRTAVMAAFKRA
jgi:hypothetical protein